MKKIFLIIAILLFTTACSTNLSKLNLKKLESKIDNKETFILYLTDESDMGLTLKKTLNKVSKENNINSFYLNTEKLKEKDKEKLSSYFTFEDTNIVLFIKDGKEITTLSRIDDVFISLSNLKDELKEHGYIK